MLERDSSDSSVTWPWHLLPRSELVGYCRFGLAGSLYGALHLLAWNYPFADPIHRRLWRISGLMVTSLGPALPLIKMLEHLVTVVFTPPRGLRHKLQKIALTATLLLLGCLGLVYAFARVYIVIECLISFAYSPDGVFQQPRWSYYVPHIS